MQIGCAQQQVVTKSPLELQAVQSKEFETAKKIAFAATLSVLQDLGYIVDNASFKTGLINAKSPVEMKFQAFVGNVMSNVKTTAFIEELTPGRTKIRVNFVQSKNATNRNGRMEKEVPITTPNTYQDFFTKVQQGIFIRKNT